MNYILLFISLPIFRQSLFMIHLQIWVLPSQPSQNYLNTRGRPRRLPVRLTNKVKLTKAPSYLKSELLPYLKTTTPLMVVLSEVTGKREKGEKAFAAIPVRYNALKKKVAAWPWPICLLKQAAAWWIMSLSLHNTSFNLYMIIEIKVRTFPSSDFYFNFT